MHDQTLIKQKYAFNLAQNPSTPRVLHWKDIGDTHYEINM